jgi:hypothetical protein
MATLIRTDGSTNPVHPTAQQWTLEKLESLLSGEVSIRRAMNGYVVQRTDIEDFINVKATQYLSAEEQEAGGIIGEAVYINDAEVKPTPANRDLFGDWDKIQATA